jgi:hypothetical protein
VRRNEKRHPIFTEAEEKIPEVAASDRVDASRGFVEEHDPRFVQKRRGER